MSKILSAIAHNIDMANQQTSRRVGLNRVTANDISKSHKDNNIETMVISTIRRVFGLDYNINTDTDIRSLSNNVSELSGGMVRVAHKMSSKLELDNINMERDFLKKFAIAQAVRSPMPVSSVIEFYKKELKGKGSK
ncbi:MAG: hypothetical protein LBL75_03005 [Rickettsiales bacterium]|jgi:tetrahydromethanopterin S-methyltransferase subunit H|nr:hypothetical protein [Rickettsiales bacterium]